MCRGARTVRRLSAAKKTRLANLTGAARAE
jgi:hypothetical protein